MTLASTSKLLVLPGARGWSSFSAAIWTTSLALGSAKAGAAHAKTAQISTTKLLDLFQSMTAVWNRDGGFSVQSVASRGPPAPPLADPHFESARGAVPRIRFARHMISYNTSRNLGVPDPSCWK